MALRVFPENLSLIGPDIDFLKSNKVLEKNNWMHCTPVVYRAALPHDTLSSYGTGLPCCIATRYIIFIHHWPTVLHCHAMHYLHTSLVNRTALRMPHDALSSYVTGLPCCIATRCTIFIRHWSTALHCACHTMHYLHTSLVYRAALPRDALSSYVTGQPHCTAHATRCTIFIRHWSTVLHCHMIHYLSLV